MACLWNGYDPKYYEYEKEFPTAFPWKKAPNEDVPRFIKGDDGYWYNPQANETGRALLSFTGDLMCEPAQCREHRYGDSYFFHPAFQYVRSIFKNSDFAVSNLETTISDNSPYAGQYHVIGNQYHCNGPESYLDALRYAGLDALVNANNHDCDSGIMGLEDTNRAVERHGFMRTGTMVGQERAILVKINGIKVAILSWSTKYNKLDANLTEKGIREYLNPYIHENACADVQWARDHGAEFVVGYIHWGKDYDMMPNEQQMEYLPQIAECGVDYVVGSHTHCLQHYTNYTRKDGKVIPVMFSMGNFVTNERKELCKHTGILQLILTKKEGAVQVEEAFIPCYVFDQFGTGRYVVVPADPAFAGTDCQKLHDVRDYVRGRIGPELQEPKTCKANLKELFEVMGLEAPANSEFTAVTRLCSRPAATRPGAVYFASGKEEKVDRLMVIKNKPAAILAPVEWPEEEEVIIIENPHEAFKKAYAYMRPMIDTKVIAITGTQGKTLTRQLLCHGLSKKYSVLTHKDTCHGDTGIWQTAIPYNDFCVVEIQNDEPVGKDTMLKLLKPDYVLCTDDFAPAEGVKLPFAWQKKCVGGAEAFLKELGIDRPFEGFTYESNTQNIVDCDGVTVVYDLACRNAEAVLEAAKQLPGRLLVMGTNLPETEAAFRWDAAAMTERQREIAVLEQLQKGDVLVLCCDRSGDLDFTLRRLFGLSDGYIKGAR